MDRISDYDFELPQELIASEPLAVRDDSRLLLADRTLRTLDDSIFRELPEFLSSDDLLVINDTKVFPARLIGRSQTGAMIEVFLMEEHDDGLWEALARPARRSKEGKTIVFGEGLSGTIEKVNDGGRVLVRLSSGTDLSDAIDRYGRTPLPPYIKRDKELPDTDRERYQTVFAQNRGAIAAPTAGLHFTDATFERLREKDIDVARITLHVGYGTFEPVRVENVTEHRVLPERYEISEETAEKLCLARESGCRIIAVGTTTTRALESNIAANGTFMATTSTADLTILPGYRFSAVNGLVTNFHLPKSSLLILVSAFAGRDFIMKAYKHAVAERYRFYSYGDCMLII